MNGKSLRWGIALLLVLAMPTSVLVGCGGSKASDDANPETTQVDEEEQTPEVSPDESAALTIELVAGEPNEYSQEVVLSEDTDMPVRKLCYFVPAGVYEVTNTGEYPVQFNLYTVETQWVDGWEEPVDSNITMIMDGESATVEVPEGWYVYIASPDQVTMVQQ